MPNFDIPIFEALQTYTVTGSQREDKLRCKIHLVFLTWQLCPTLDVLTNKLLPARAWTTIRSVLDL